MFQRSHESPDLEIFGHPCVFPDRAASVSRYASCCVILWAVLSSSKLFYSFSLNFKWVALSSFSISNVLAPYSTVALVNNGSDHYSGRFEGGICPNRKSEISTEFRQGPNSWSKFITPRVPIIRLTVAMATTTQSTVFVDWYWHICTITLSLSESVPLNFRIRTFGVPNSDQIRTFGVPNSDLRIPNSDLRNYECVPLELFGVTNSDLASWSEPLLTTNEKHPVLVRSWPTVEKGTKH